MEDFLVYAAVVIEPMFGVAPEALNAVDMVPAEGSPFLFAYHHVRAAHRQGGVSVPIVGEVQTSRLGMGENAGQDRLPLAGIQGEKAHPAISLENAKDNDLAPRSPASLPGSAASKHGFIAFDGTPKGFPALLVQSQRGTDEVQETFDTLAIRQPLPTQPVAGHAQDEVIQKRTLGSRREPRCIPNAPGDTPAATAAALAPPIGKLP